MTPQQQLSAQFRIQPVSSLPSTEDPHSSSQPACCRGSREGDSSAGQPPQATPRCSLRGQAGRASLCMAHGSGAGGSHPPGRRIPAAAREPWAAREEHLRLGHRRAASQRPPRPLPGGSRDARKLRGGGEAAERSGEVRTTSPAALGAEERSGRRRSLAGRLLPPPPSFLSSFLLSSPRLRFLLVFPLLAGGAVAGEGSALLSAPRDRRLPRCGCVGTSPR